MTVTEPTIIYPYLFQTSGFRIIDDIRAELESQRDWDFADTAYDARRFQDIAADQFGCTAPSDEQFALRNYLIQRQAGQNISTYAWGLYASAMAPTKCYA